MLDTSKYEGLSPNQLRNLANLANDEERYEDADYLWALAGKREAATYDDNPLADIEVDFYDDRPAPVDAEEWLRRP